VSPPAILKNDTVSRRVLACHNGKTLPQFPGTSGLYGSVQGEEVGLPDRLAPLGAILHGFARYPPGFNRVVGFLSNARYHFFHGG